jgi:endonuclease/exonuclease/phosphatase family metal-dependent hydrolase
MALICEITIQGQTLVLYNVHLESRGNDELRIGQLSEMLTEIRKNPAETPIVVAGDGRRSVPNHAKPAAIDWILTIFSLYANNPEIHESVTASDHFPLSLELRGFHRS